MHNRSSTFPLRRVCSVSSLMLMTGVIAIMSMQTCHSQQAASVSLATLRAGHPRLILTNEDLERVKPFTAEDPLAKQWLTSLRESAVRILTANPVEYRLVGPRLLSQSRACMDRVYTLALMYRVEGDKRFAERARKELLTAAAFKDWNPSHFLDTAEMSHAFGIGYDWLYDTLSDEDRATIRTALIEKGLKPAQKVYEGGGWWARATHNWNQVCNGGIGIGALAIADEERELAEYILRQAVESIKRPMARFAPDGGWDEGPGYWNYATRYNAYFLAALDSALGTDFGLSAIEDFDETGMFWIYSVGPLNRVFNFADGGDRAGRAGQMMWFSRKFDRPVYAWHERNQPGGPQPHDLIWFDPRGEGPKASGLPLDKQFRNIDVAFFRSAWEDPQAIFVGFKGGNNRANHSHLDLGTFVLDALGQRWAVDLGGDDYNLPGYFGNQRWTYYRLRTEGHNTLVINEENQDPAARAPLIAFRSTPNRAYAVADLSAAYKPAKRVWRGVALLDRKQVLIQDEIEAAQPLDVLWGMLTPAEMQINGATAVLTQGEARLLAQIVEPAGARFDTVSANPPKPQAQQPNVKKLVVRLSDKLSQGRIVVLLSPYGAKDPQPAAGGPTLEPLATWVAQAKQG